MNEYHRTFRLWDARVSHDQLLLRSPRDRNHARNVDIRFADVRYLDLPTMFDRVVIAVASGDDISRASERVGEPVPPERVFVFAIEGRRYLVVASDMIVEENDLDLFETSLVV